jgi:peptidoglycan/xylan/chitin deacetylase (PgdA/CDA1 family)
VATPIPVRPAEHIAPAVPVRASGPKITYSQCHVDGPYVALTFDDGPHGANTPRLLDMLKQRKVKATFFVVGQCVAEYPEIAKRIVEEGHEIANHSWSHPQLTRLGEGTVSEQLGKTHDVVKQTTGVTMTLLRPPYGAFTPNQAAWAYRRWGYRNILWDVDTLDWKIRNASHVQSYILGHPRLDHPHARHSQNDHRRHAQLDRRPARQGVQARDRLRTARHGSPARAKAQGCARAQSRRRAGQHRAHHEGADHDRACHISQSQLSATAVISPPRITGGSGPRGRQRGSRPSSTIAA